MAELRPRFETRIRRRIFFPGARLLVFGNEPKGRLELALFRRPARREQEQARHTPLIVGLGARKDATGGRPRALLYERSVQHEESLGRDRRLRRAPR